MVEEDYQEALHNYAGFVLEFRNPFLVCGCDKFQVQDDTPVRHLA